MPRAFQCNPCPRFRLGRLRRVRQDFGKQERGSIEGKSLMRNRAYRLRKQRAFHGRRSEMLPVEERLHRFDGHHAMMLSVHPAAGRKPRLRRAAKRKQRRNLRKAEHQQQRDGYSPSHRRGFAYRSTSAPRRPARKSPAASLRYPIRTIMRASLLP